jgi:cysteine synthase B
LRDVPEITHFVAGLGTSGTLMGVGKYLKQAKPVVQIWAVEPPSGEMVDGLRSLEDGYIPPIFIENHGAELLDRKVVVRARESIEWTRRLTEVGLFVGLSSGAIMSGAVKCAKLIPEDETATIVTIVCDDGWKYLSTGAWSDDIDDVVERAKKIIYF